MDYLSPIVVHRFGCLANRCWSWGTYLGGTLTDIAHLLLRVLLGEDHLLGRGCPCRCRLRPHYAQEGIRLWIHKSVLVDQSSGRGGLHAKEDFHSQTHRYSSRQQAQSDHSLDTSPAPAHSRENHYGKAPSQGRFPALE